VFFCCFCRFASCIAATKAHICINNRNPHIYHTNPHIIHNHNIHHPSSRTNATSNIQQVAQVQHPSSNIQQSSKGVQHNKVTTSIIQQHEGTEPLTRLVTSRHHGGVRSSLSATKTTRTVRPAARCTPTRAVEKRQDSSQPSTHAVEKVHLSESGSNPPTTDA
jgi:hypothetical protein